MLPVDRFYLLSHIFISFTGAILLLALWYNIRRRFRKILDESGSNNRVDKGLAYLSMALFMWVVAGIWTYIGTTLEINQSLFYGIDSQISTVNNLFFLLALSYFGKAPSFLVKNDYVVNKLIWAVIGVSLSSGFLFYFFDGKTPYGLRMGYLPDLLLSSFLSFLLLLTFYKTLFYRELKIVAIIFIVSIILMFYSQLPQSFLNIHDNFTNNIIKIVAKTSLISIFLVLATIWVIQLASTPIPSEMSVRFMDWSLIKITIPSRNINGEIVDFGAKTTQFRNLLKFAIRRKYAEGTDQCMELAYGKEIPRQTYLTRIIENINDILRLDEEQKLDRNDLFTFTGHGRYRLRMLPENITLEKVLLQEFLKDVQNQSYERIVTNCNTVTNKHNSDKITSI